MNTPITRKVALEQGLVHYFTGKPCKRGHISLRNVQSCNCLECWREDSKNTREHNPEEFKRKKKEDYYKNRDKYLSYWRENREENWEEIYKTRKNDEQYKEYMKSYLQVYFKRDGPRAKQLARTRARKLKQKNATPKWADLKSIQDVYLECASITKTTGIIHHVDHIVPINGDDVCGLHVHYNLRIIPATENIEKSNSLDESLILCG